MAEARTPFNVRASSARTAPHSPWHSPVPYLFGGLAAMLGLIAFALLILACSYWKLSGYLENGNQSHERDVEAGEEAGGEESSDYDNNHGEKQAVVFQDKILVIMAGEVKPTFLATPMSSSSRSSSFADNQIAKSCSCSEKTEKSAENDTTDDHQEQRSERLEISTQPQQSTDQTH